MALTVRESLELEPLRSVRVLAGEGSLDRVITSASIIEVPDVWKWLHGGEMLLTTLYPFRDSAEEQVGLIRQLASRNIACLVVKLQRFVDTLPEDAVDLARREELPLFVLPPDISFIDVLEAVWGRIWNRRPDPASESENLGKEALNMVAEGKGIQPLVSFMAKMLRSPVSFHDSDGNLVAVTCDRSADTVLRAAERIDVRTLASLAETSRMILEVTTGARRTQPGSGTSERIEDEAGGIVQPAVVVRAEARDRRYGYLAVWDSSRLSPESVKVLDSFALAAALEMARQRAAREVELRHLAQFLREIVSGTMSEDVAKQQARSLGIQMSSRNVILSVGVCGRSPGEPAEERSLEPLVREVVSKYNPYAITATIGRYVVVLWPLSDDAPCDRRTLEKSLDPWRGYLLTRISGPVIVGVGRVARTFQDIPAAYRTSKECCDLLQRFNAGGPAWLFFDGLGILRVLGMCPERDVEAFVDEVLGPLSYGDDGSGVLEETLYCYLQHNGNLQRTAQDLYVHINTVRYRLRKACRLLDMDLDSMSDRVTLWTALTVRRLRKLQGGDVHSDKNLRMNLFDPDKGSNRERKK